jgi:hypothetical protein
LRFRCCQMGSLACRSCCCDLSLPTKLHIKLPHTTITIKTRLEWN